MHDGEAMNQSLLGLRRSPRVGPMDLVLGPTLVVEGVLVGAMFHGPLDDVFRSQSHSKPAEREDGIEQAILGVLLHRP